MAGSPRGLGLCAGLLWMFGSACAPACPALCGKLERCALTGEVERRACEESCSRELATARELDDRQTLREFNQHRICIGGASCDDLEAGACFEEGDFPWTREPG